MTRRPRLLAAALFLALWAPACGSPAMLVPQGAPVDIDRALVSAARTLLLTPGSVEPSLVVTLIRFRQCYADGFEYSRYRAKRPDGRVVGDFTRIRVYPDASSRIDFAVSHDASGITSVTEVQPTLFLGKPFPAFRKVFAPILRRPPADYAGGMSLFFGALSDLAPAAAGPPKLVSLPPSRKSTIPFVTLASPELKLGEPWPQFEATDIHGRPAGSAAFKGRVTLVLVAQVKERMSRDMLQAVTARVGASLKLLIVVCDDMATLAEYSRYMAPNVLDTGALVLDAKSELRAKLKAPLVPYLYVFGEKGKLLARSFWAGVASLDELLARAAQTVGK